MVVAMGCDIHGVIEVKRSDLANGADALWMGVVRLDELLARDYDRFAYLFGVRHYPERQDLPHKAGAFADRGLPYDPSDMTEHYHEQRQPDAHSETWAYQSEIESALAGTELGESHGDFRDESWVTTVEIGGQIESLFEKTEYRDSETRWVVWFDN